MMNDEDDVKALRASIEGLLGAAPVLNGSVLTTEPELLPTSLQDQKSEYFSDVATSIESLASLLRHCPTSALQNVLAQDLLRRSRYATRSAGGGDSPTHQPLKPGLLIEEVDTDSLPEEIESELTLTERLLLLIATIDGPIFTQSGLACVDGHSYLLPCDQIHETDAIDENYRRAKAAAKELYTILNSSAATQVTPHSVPDCIAFHALPGLIDALEKSICAYDRYSKLSAKASRLETYSGPEEWERFLAMAQFAWVVLQISSDSNLGLCALFRDSERTVDTPDFYLWQSIEPLIIAAIVDPSTNVQTISLWTIHQLASAGNLDEQRDMWKERIYGFHDANVCIDRYQGALLRLMPFVKQAVVACDERVFPACIAAASSLAGAEVLHCCEEEKTALFEAMLEEGERKAHQTSHAETWLRHVPKQVFKQVNDAEQTRLLMYFRRLMPLLLQWSSNRQSKSVRTAALRAIHMAMESICPQRATAHISLVWSVLQIIFIDEVELSGRASEDVMQAAVSLGSLLWSLPGGQDLKSRLLSVSTDPSKEMVHSHKSYRPPSQQTGDDRHCLVCMILRQQKE